MIPSRTHIIAWLTPAILTAWAWRTPPIADQPDWDALGVSRGSSLVYSADGLRRMTLEVYRPSRAVDAAASSPRPAVLAVHGGSWVGGSMTAFRYDSRNTVVRLAQSGMVVFAIDYRLARPASPSWPEVLDELRAAVRWVRRHSDDFGVDPGRIAVVGQSSGAHLALLLATLPDATGSDGISSRIQAVVDFYGPTDLVGLMSFRHLAHEPARAFLGTAGAEFAHRASQASPLEQVTPDDPPMLLIHGDDDAWVPVDQSVRMANALDRAGVPHQLIVVKGARHGFETELKDPVERDLIPEIVDFLERVWNGRLE